MHASQSETKRRRHPVHGDGETPDQKDASDRDLENGECSSHVCPQLRGRGGVRAPGIDRFRCNIMARALQVGEGGRIAALHLRSQLRANTSEKLFAGISTISCSVSP